MIRLWGMKLYLCIMNLIPTIVTKHDQELNIYRFSNLVDNNNNFIILNKYNLVQGRSISVNFSIVYDENTTRKEYETGIFHLNSILCLSKLDRKRSKFMNKKRIWILLMALAVTLGLITGGVLAWLTDTKTTPEKTFTVGDVTYMDRRRNYK